MADQLIRKLWASYERDILTPAGAPPIQVQECRRAFYAGARGLLAAIDGILEAALAAGRN